MYYKQLKPLLTKQREAFLYGINIVHPALFMKMRTGKTITTIRICKYFNCQKNLISCPYSAFDSWSEELIKEKQRLPIQLTGTRKQRLKILEENFNTSKWFLNSKEGHFVIPELGSLEWESCIVDESTFIKAPRKKLKSLDKNGKKKWNTSGYYENNFRGVNHRFVLTGTPSPESLLDYFQQLQFLNPDILGFNNYYEFFHKCFIIPNSRSYNYVMNQNYKKEFYKKLKTNCFFLTRKEAGIGGGKKIIKRILETSSEFKKVYKRLKKDFILEYKEDNKRTKYSIVKLSWLRQLYSGFINDKLVFDFKLNEIKYLLSTELKNESIVIWCNFNSELQYLYSELKKNYTVEIIHGQIDNKKRTEIVKHFNSKKIEILISNCKCFEFGKNLSIADTEIYYSLPLAGLTWEQTQDRLIHLRKEKDILIIVLLLKNTLERKIFNDLKKKTSESQLIENIIKNLIVEE